MTHRHIGHRTFVDGTRRPVYQDSVGQYILDDEGNRIYGAHLIRERMSLVAHPAGILLLALTCCCAAAVLGSLIAIAQVLNWRMAFTNFDEAAIVGFVIGVLLTGPVTIAGLIVSPDKVVPTVLVGSGVAAFCSWLISFAITAMEAA